MQQDRQNAREIFRNAPTASLSSYTGRCPAAQFDYPGTVGFVDGIFTIFGHGMVVDLGQARDEAPGHLRVHHIARRVAANDLCKNCDLIIASAPGLMTL